MAVRKLLEVVDLKEDGVPDVSGGMRDVSLDAQMDLRSPRSDGAGTERE